MDIGLSHLITVQGEAIKAYWDTFNPNLSLGTNHEILVFEGDVNLDQVFDEIPSCLTKQNYSGQFQLVDKTETMERFEANYSISLLPKNAGINVKTFLFTSNGTPWAICSLEKAVAIKKGVNTVFNFTSTINVNNKLNIAKNPWAIDVGKFNIKYAGKVTAVEVARNSDFVFLSASKTLNNDSSDDDIRRAIVDNSVAVETPYIFEDGRVGIKLVAKSNTDVVGIKAIFIRVLWNMGILIYIDSISWAGNTLPNLTLVKGHQLKLTFGINFKELKNETTI